MVEDRRPRILIVTRNLPPLVGGMERLNWHMAKELAKRAEVRIIGPAGSAALAPTGVEVREAPLRPLWSFLHRARLLARSEARTWQPDIVLAGSGLTAPIARSAAKVAKAVAAVYVHGLDVALSHPVYRIVWLPAIRRAHSVIANSRATAKRCRDIGVPEDRIGIVYPGVEVPKAAEVAPGCADGVRERLGLDGRALLISVGRLTTRKGVREFVTEALPRIASVRPDVMLLVVGDAPIQALHAEAQTPASILKAARDAGVEEHIRFLGNLDYPELEEIYCAAQVHVFPVRDIPGDPEGFGMVAVEAAVHGLPTVAFASGGVVDAVSDGLSGKLVASGDYVAMADAVCRVLADREGWSSGCIEFGRRFAWEHFGTQVSQWLSRPQ
ncbi:MULTISPECIES: glycosyltransferase family 4 protein [Pseudoxanthomonas]|uniref:Phosphatidylinositol alpha-1,6-mannosyltransferase n=1 Tax=Pseudoxanthomonas winnipegensis TaxID=2480810 RepID=A0AAW8GCN4_9GAMM|nr:phosphatidylinositol alpha-1,6-mannosyltransferase [Pseudoxanthomonas winnipegensis]MDQ1132832.1 phosphatidylinositol alpha-1,6-mannosyltransferase [Pseudoxanthomonas winnipegensis]MDR6137161.1 phosphatidylinositol alpha-1,6-mannosyltransferase [Pseudoxanthomonas sp. SORGH_AS_0997]